MRPSLLPSLLYFASCFSFALSFTVTVGPSPAQCGSLNVTWTGGQAPFEIILIPVYNIPRNISVPSTSFSNNQGSYQISNIPFTKGSQFLVAMSDATGFGTGGVSELLTVGDPLGGASCNTTNPTLSYSFSLPSSLQQCNQYVFNGYEGAALPVTITGFIPGGDLFTLRPPASAGASFTWTANVAAGNTIVFVMTDARGNSGGSSDTETVALSDDRSCLSSVSPSSTVTSTPSSTTTSSSASSPIQTSTPGVSKGTIAGAVFGAVLAVTAVVALAVFYLKRQRSGRSPYGLGTSRNAHRPNSVELDPGMDNFPDPAIYPFPYQTDSVSRLPPPVIIASTATPVSSTSPSVHASEAPYTFQQHSRSNSNTDSFAAFADMASSSMSSSGRRKAAMAGISSYQSPTRFIVHTDAEDVPEGESEVVELPPQYSERRAPVTNDTGERPLSSMTGLSTDLAYLSGPHIEELPQSTSHPPAE